ncbi:hypothetical protein HO133_005048 [Letharia lupina]|uniref:Uncharacterized protein n=1 Tax=Letharia lupina TaxID=560253 RepID=A0A8H6C930_9LECA|nr:uncharacterized protein HO133_005048 [Letharia lupina]KAF6219223.1 hypothetical protein HO133_005048 [Letharia lupina]
MVGIAATAWYTGDFANSECSLEFIPTRSTVTANVTNSSITVVKSSGSAATDPEPTGLLVNNTVTSLHFLSKMGPSLYVSVMGDAFEYNVHTTYKSSAYGNLTRREVGLRATEASFDAILDDILGIYGSGQIAIANETTSTTIAGTFGSYLFGKPLVLGLILPVNLVILLVIVIEGIRARFWRHLPQFDILDFKSTVTAASLGGNNISKKVQRQRGEGDKWTADAADRMLGDIKMCLPQGDFAEPRIILDGGLLMQDEADGGGTEMDDGMAPLETEPYTGAPAAWSPIGQHNEHSSGQRKTS